MSLTRASSRDRDSRSVDLSLNFKLVVIFSLNVRLCNKKNKQLQQQKTTKTNALLCIINCVNDYVLLMSSSEVDGHRDSEPLGPMCLQTWCAVLLSSSRWRQSSATSPGVTSKNINVKHSAISCKVSALL